MKTDTDLQIGFAGTFYTLWSVSSEAIYSTTPHGVHYLSNVKSIKTYHQNLSKDLESAQAKAKKMGCQNLMPDDSLKGKKRSFSTSQYFEYDYKNYEFNCGRNRYDDIRECQDLKYLIYWIGSEYHGLEFARARVMELDSNYVIYKKNLVTKGRKKELQLMARILAGKVEVVAVSNLSPILEELNKWEVRVNVANPKTKIEREFNDFWKYGYAVNVVTDMEMTRKTYRGFEYYTPAGKRSFKKTIFTVNNENLILI